MTFKPALWRPIAVLLSIVNIVAAGFAAGSTEPWHAATHAALAVAFGLWAQHLRARPGGSERPAQLEDIEAELGALRQELLETQERLDFTERMLAQAPEPRRAEPGR